MCYIVDNRSDYKGLSQTEMLVNRAKLWLMLSVVRCMLWVTVEWVDRYLYIIIIIIMFLKG